MSVPRKAIVSLSTFLFLTLIVLQKWEKGSLQNAVTKTMVRSKKNTTNDCFNVCLQQVNQHHEHWGGRDLRKITDVASLVVEARKELETKLIRDYGEENFRNIFLVNETFRQTFSPAKEVSTLRFKRKMKIKILSMQQAVRNELNMAGTCACVDEHMEETQSLRRRRNLGPTDHYERFVWASGGHSSAAGHGNLFNESYTSYLEQAITPVFRAIGIDFEGRNYAMGGTSSSPEIALCQEAVFGTDADVITYDFGMTDAGKWQKKVMYDERIAIHPNRPALLDINILVEDSGEHATTIQREEDRGLTILYLDPNEFGAMKNAFPDSFGKNQEQIDAMPAFVRNFKCREFYEKGDPFCGEKKYDNNEICPDRGMMADWHPGWKMMALWGNTFALFLADMLIDAIYELESTSNRTNLLTQLHQEEAKDYKGFLESATSKDSTDYDLVPRDIDLVSGANASIFFTEPSVCRTARLPSQSRYLGIMSETAKGGVYDYFKGVSMEAARNISSDKNSEVPMPLVYDQAERQKGCEVELNRDYKDYFFASNNMGWTTLAIPNDAEKRVYVEDSQKLRGVLVMCLVTCPWGDCLKGEMRKEAILNGLTKFEVNGLPVTNITNLIDDCMVLRGKQGHQWQPNDEGRWKLRSRVLGNGTDFAFLRISSLILL